ncbi:MAG TPA: copper-binding protein [Polyangiales bacterium]|nr:copper-binding protein [Polyangiales bacterium]
MKLALVGLGLLVAVVSCKGSDAGDGHYSVRGQVKSAEGSGDDARALIHHEHIPSFKDRDGNASPMESMSMNFALGPGVSKDALKPAAKVAIEFDVRWSSGSPLVITKVTPLPDSTPLTLTEH